MTEEKKEPFEAKILKMVLLKELENRIARYKTDQALAPRQKVENLSITKYINTQEIEYILERIISQLGGCALEQGMIFVSVKDKNGCFVTPDSDCDKIIVSVAYGQEFIIRNNEYPPEENGADTTESSPISKQTSSKVPASETSQSKAMPEEAVKPVAVSDGNPANKIGIDNDLIRTKQLQLSKELRRKFDELWINRKGLGVDFNSPGALKIELQDSPRITKIAREIGGGKLAIRIDRESGLIKVYDESNIYLKWELPKNEM